MKSITVFALVMTAFMFTSNTQANYTVNRFPVYDGPSDQTKPDIDGDIVVWQGSDTDIYWRSGDADPNVIAIGGEQTDPAISYGIVIWLDKGDSDHDVYGYDTVSQLDLTVIENDGVSQFEPAISGTTAAYRENKEIYIHPIGGTASPVASAAGSRYEFAIDGSIVAWMEMVDAPQIKVLDMDAGGSPLQITSGTNWHRNPAVSGRVIVWDEDSGDGTYDIYGYNLDDPATGAFPICIDAGDQKYPAVSGSIVVWQDQSDGAGSYDIWAIDLSSAAAGPFEISDGTGDNQKPAVSGNTIVWQRKGANWDIYGAELLVPSTVTITIIDPNGGEQFLAGSPIDITWTSVGDVNDIMIEFSDNDGTDWQIVTATTENDGIFTWDAVPTDANSIECIIHVSDVADSSTWDISDAVFTVFQCEAELTADLTGDCFVDITDIAELARQWLLCGNPYDPTWCSQ